jgi:hypothetical protein
MELLEKLPDVIITDDKEMSLLIDIVFPDGSNFNTKETEKLKYKDLWGSGTAGCGK